MARNLIMYGAAYSTSGDVNVELDVNDIAVTSEAVTTINQASPGVNTATNPILKFALPDEYQKSADVLVKVKVTGGTLWLAGFGEDNSMDQMFGENPGQLKSQVRYNDLDPYDVTDADCLANGAALDDNGNVGEFHLDIVDGATVTFNYALPDYSPFTGEDVAPE